MSYTPNYRPPEKDQGPLGGHTYISGYGFVEKDPRMLREQHLKKDVSVISAAMVGVLLLPSLFFVPVSVVMQTIVNALGKITHQFVILSTLSQEIRELILYLLSLLIPICFLRLFFKDVKISAPRAAGSPQKKSWGYAVPLTLAAVALTAVGSDFVSDFLYQFNIIALTPSSMLPGNNISLTFYMVRVIFLPAVLEEYLFRGLILHSLRRHGDTFAVVLSSAFYGMAQYTVTRNLSGFVYGLILGYFVLRTGSFLTAVICHLCTGALNGAIVLIQHFLPSRCELIEIVVFIVVLAAGIVSFILLCTKEDNAFIMSSINSASSTARKLKLCLSSTLFIILLILWAWQMLRSIQII